MLLSGVWHSVAVRHSARLQSQQERASSHVPVILNKFFLLMCAWH